MMYLLILLYNLQFTIYYFTNLVHPCDKANKGGCSQICNKRKEFHVCSCKAGFVLGKDKKSCNKGDLNIFTFPQIHVQLTYINVYHNTEMNYFSSLVHPCDKASKGGCSQLCNKRKEKYECACKDGFLLGDDKRTCNKG